jgi:hypothetical protein
MEIFYLKFSKTDFDFLFSTYILTDLVGKNWLISVWSA